MATTPYTLYNFSVCAALNCIRNNRPLFLQVVNQIAATSRGSRGSHGIHRTTWISIYSTSIGQITSPRKEPPDAMGERILRHPQPLSYSTTVTIEVLVVPLLNHMHGSDILHLCTGGDLTGACIGGGCHEAKIIIYCLFYSIGKCSGNSINEYMLQTTFDSLFYRVL